MSIRLPFKKSFRLCMSCGFWANKHFKSQDQFGKELELYLCQGCAIKDIALLFTREFSWRERLIILFKGCI